MSDDKKIYKAIQLIEIGKKLEAENLLKKIVKKNPKNYIAHTHLGMLCFFKKDFNKSKEHILKSLNIKSDFNLVKNLVIVLIELKDWELAFEWSQKLTSVFNNEVSVQLNHALILRELKMMDQCISLYKQIIGNFPTNINAYIAYGFLLNRNNKSDEAISIYLKGLQLQNNNFPLLYNIGIAYLNNLDFNNADKYFELAKKQNSTYLDLLLTHAMCQAKLRKWNDAIESISDCEKIDSKNPLVPFQMGTILRQKGDNNNAEKYFLKALDLHKNSVIEMPENLVEVYHHLGICHLSQEKFEQGLQYYSYRVKRIGDKKFGNFDDFDLPELNNSDEVVISWEQGIGDQILYISLIEHIKSKVKSLTYVTTDKLYNLLNKNITGISLIKDTDYDFNQKTNNFIKKINLASLMNYINDWNSFFKSQMIWKGNREIIDKYQKKYKVDNKKIIGISWMSKNEKIGDEKSIEIDNFLPLFQKNSRVISLQYGDINEDLKKLFNIYKKELIYDDNLDYYDDLDGLAALISICDVVVTCSNVTAHLAGRLGVKCYVMIPKYFGEIWYWCNKGKSRWYQSVDVIKQAEDGTWDKEFEKIQNLIKI